MCKGQWVSDNGDNHPVGRYCGVYAAGAGRGGWLGEFDKHRSGLEIAICGKTGGLFVWGADGTLLWQHNVPTAQLSKGDWDGDGVEEIMAFGLGANVDGIFSVWNGKGERLYAISFLPTPSRRVASDSPLAGDKRLVAGRSHALPGGHEGIRRQIDLDGNGRVDVIVPFGAWHWGSESILVLMEGTNRTE
jgi:hypothetical protein